MNIFLLVRGDKKSTTVDLVSPTPLTLAAFVLILLTASLTYLGWLIGKHWGEADNTSQALPAWQMSLQDGRDQIDRISQKSRDDLNALALQLGRIEARLTRLDALGERLANMADLDTGEFNFIEIPAQGGPAVDAVSQASLDDILSRFDELQRQMTDREKQLEILESLLIDRELSIQVLPNGRPVKKGWLSSRYGKRADPFTGKVSWHSGIDFAGKYGSDVIAVASGIVIWSGKRPGYGRMVEINHGNGYSTRYAHNSENLVQVGDTIEKGQVIAKMGSSGRSTGPHVHFEVVLNGKTVNPEKYVIAAAKD